MTAHGKWSLIAGFRHFDIGIAVNLCNETGDCCYPLTVIYTAYIRSIYKAGTVCKSFDGACVKVRCFNLCKACSDTTEYIHNFCDVLVIRKTESDV